MRKTLIALAVALLASTTTVWALPSFTGSLSTPAGVTATPLWDHPSGGFKISWTIDQMADGSWCYDYLLTNATGGGSCKESKPYHFPDFAKCRRERFLELLCGQCANIPAYLGDCHVLGG